MILTMTLMTAMMSTTNQLESGDSTRTLRVDQRERSYILHVPPSYDGSKPVPAKTIRKSSCSRFTEPVTRGPAECLRSASSVRQHETFPPTIWCGHSSRNIRCI